jgi:hypothetical protein
VSQEVLDANKDSNHSANCHESLVGERSAGEDQTSTLDALQHGLGDHRSALGDRREVVDLHLSGDAGQRRVRHLSDCLVGNLFEERDDPPGREHGDIAGPEGWGQVGLAHREGRLGTTSQRRLDHAHTIEVWELSRKTCALERVELVLRRWQTWLMCPWSTSSCSWWWSTSPSS